MSPPSELLALHADVDARALPLVQLHADRLQCRRGCAGCCQDGITVFEVEAARIRAEAASVLAEPPAPEGGCAFLAEDGACRIYAQRPYVCRTQGLPLRWLGAGTAGEAVEYRDVCPLNEAEGARAIEDLDPSACWTIGPVEASLAQLQADSGAPGRRVPLRALFD